MKIKSVGRMVFGYAFIFLMFYSLGIRAEQSKLVEFGTNSNPKRAEDVISSFIYSDSIKEVDGYIRFWTLVNFKGPMKYADSKYFSSKDYKEVDCKKDRLRNIGFILYAKGMGQGAVVASDSQGEGVWRLVAPDSNGADLLAIICKRNK